MLETWQRLVPLRGMREMIDEGSYTLPVGTDSSMKARVVWEALREGQWGWVKGAHLMQP